MYFILFDIDDKDAGHVEDGHFLQKSSINITKVKPCTNVQSKNLSHAFGKSLLYTVISIYIFPVL